MSLSITTVGSLIAGRAYHVICNAALVNGIHSTPIFTWLDSDDRRLASGDGINVGLPTAKSLSLEFNLLRFSMNGTYTCRVILFSLALQTPLITSTTINIDVQRKHHNYSEMTFIRGNFSCRRSN